MGHTCLDPLLLYYYIRSAISRGSSPSTTAFTMSASDYYISDMAPSEDHDDLDSLPSISSSLLSSEVDSTDAQKEWEESLEQMQLLLTMIIVPFAGKFLGRKFAYWSRLPCPALPAQAWKREGCCKEEECCRD